MIRDIISRADSFNPKTIPNLTLWLDATDTSTITLNAGNVSQWRDKSGNGRHASQGTASAQPLYQPSGLNGRPTIRSDGGDVLEFPWDGTINDMSYYIVYRRAIEMGADPTSSGPIGWTSSVRGIGIQVNESAVHRIVIAFGDYLNIFNHSKFSSGTPMLVRVAKTVQGTSTRTTEAKAFGHFSGSAIDNRWNDQNYENCLFRNLDNGRYSISEFIQFSRKLSSSEEASIAAYYNRKYGTEL